MKHLQLISNSFNDWLGRIGKARSYWALGIALASIILGLILDWRGFAVNTLAGLFQIFIGFLIAIFILDKVLDDRKKQQWLQVRTVIGSRACADRRARSRPS